MAFPHTIPVLTGYLVLGFAYGVLMSTKGCGIFWATFMSILVYGGSIEYIAVTLFTAAFDPISAFVLAIMVNARHLFYGLSLLKKFKNMGKFKFFLIFWLTDETFSILSTVTVPKTVPSRYFYFAISSLDYLYWVAASFIGAVFGSFISFNTKGLDFVLTALFVVLFIEQLKQKNNRIAGAIGIGGTVAALLIFGADNLVVPAMAIILAALLILRLIQNKRKENVQ